MYPLFVWAKIEYRISNGLDNVMIEVHVDLKLNIKKGSAPCGVSLFVSARFLDDQINLR